MNTQVKEINRIDWIDITRGVAIILVVLGHNIQYGYGPEFFVAKGYFENYFFKIIYSFHMPLMMWLSGYLFLFSIKKRSVLEMIKNRIDTVFIPLLLWALIPTMAEIINGKTISLLTYCGTVKNYLWFLWALLFCSMIVMFIHCYMKDSGIVYLLVIILLNLIPCIDDRWVFMFPFFVAGYMWNFMETCICIKRWNIWLIMVVFIGLLFLYSDDAYVYNTGTFLFSERTWYYQIMINLYRVAIGFVGSISVIVLVKQFIESLPISLRKGLSYCGKASLAIYILDDLLTRYVILRVTTWAYPSIVIAIFETFIVMIFCLTGYFVIKHIPFIGKIMLGGRAS
jgi:fucose 4-O-acetylase-like acetyltransferase